MNNDNIDEMKYSLPEWSSPGKKSKDELSVFLLYYVITVVLFYFIWYLILK